MQYDILLTKQAANGYLARPVLMPELVVSGENEVEALARVCAAIASVTVRSRIVRIDVPDGSESAVVMQASQLDHATKLQSMAQAATDPRFLADLRETMNDFAHIE